MDRREFLKAICALSSAAAVSGSAALESAANEMWRGVYIETLSSEDGSATITAFEVSPDTDLSVLQGPASTLDQLFPKRRDIAEWDVSPPENWKDLTDQMDRILDTANGIRFGFVGHNYQGYSMPSTSFDKVHTWEMWRAVVRSVTSAPSQQWKVVLKSCRPGMGRLLIPMFSDDQALTDPPFRVSDFAMPFDVSNDMQNLRIFLDGEAWTGVHEPSGVDKGVWSTDEFKPSWFDVCSRARSV